jgi:hypothetical protein
MQPDWMLPSQVDPWPGATPAARQALRQPPRPYQYDLFRAEPFSDAAVLWAMTVADALNADLPLRAHEEGIALAPLPTRDIVAYVRKGRCPDPRDPLMLVSECVWDWYLHALAVPRMYPRAVPADELERLVRHLENLARYVTYLRENARHDRLVAGIALQAKPLYEADLGKHFEPVPPRLREHLSRQAAWRMLRDARADLFMRLADPISDRWVRDGCVVVGFAGIARYVADSHAREIRVEVLERDGKFARGYGRLDLHRPLAQNFWLRAFVEHWVHQYVRPLAMSDETLVCGWLLACLRREVARLQLVPLLRRALLDAFRFMELVKPEVAGLARLAEPRQRQLALSKETYNCTWRELDLLARRGNQLAPGAGIDDLKGQMRQRGVTQVGWSLLCHHGEAFYKGLLRAHRVNTSVASIAAHVRLFQRVDAQRCPPLPLQRALYTADYLPLREIAELPPAFVRRAWEELERHETQGTADFFIRDEFMPILWWLRQDRPSFDKNQLRGGWTFWADSYTQRTDARIDSDDGWECLVELHNIEHGPYVAVPILGVAALIEEGEAMHHCVANFEADCRGGEYLVLSIRERATWKRAATLGLQLGRNGWFIDQLKGYANQPAPLALRRMASHVADRVNAAHDAIIEQDQRSPEARRAA